MIDRRAGLGGSEIAAVCGLNPWEDALGVWLTKTGRRDEKESNMAMRLGKWLEPFVAQEYSNLTGRSLRKGSLRQHPRLPWVIGTPDYYVVELPVGLECKYTGYLDREGWGPPGTDLVPLEYLCQCQQYMEVCDLPTWELAVISSRREFRVYVLQRDRELMGMLLEDGERFWVDHVLADVPPAITSAEMAERFLSYVHARQTVDTLIQADTQAEYWSDTLQMVKGQLVPLEELKARAEAELKLRIGEAAGIRGSDFEHTWRQSKDGKQVDWQAVAMALGASPELIAQFTTVKPGSRRFLVKWTNGGEKEGLVDGGASSE